MKCIGSLLTNVCEGLFGWFLLYVVLHVYTSFLTYVRPLSFHQYTIDPSLLVRVFCRSLL